MAKKNRNNLNAQDLQDLIESLKQDYPDTPLEDIPVEMFSQPRYPFRYSAGAQVIIKENEPYLAIFEQGNQTYATAEEVEQLEWNR